MEDVSGEGDALARMANTGFIFLLILANEAI